MGHALAALILGAAFALAGADDSHAAGRTPDSAEAKPLPVKAPPRTSRKPKKSLLNFDYPGAKPEPSTRPYSTAIANARRMAAQGYISHTNGVWVDLGCHLGVQAAENVGWWSGGVNDAQLNSMFMASPDHRANIMGPYHYVATAWAVAANGYAYIAVEFG